MRDARADTENGVTHIDAILRSCEGPNHDDKTDDGFANQYLLAMLGLPRKIGELRAALEGALEEVDSKILEPAHELLGDINPLGPLTKWLGKIIHEAIQDFIFDVIKGEFGLDLRLWEYINNSPSAKLDIKSINIPSQTLHLEGFTIPLLDLKVQVFEPITVTTPALYIPIFKPTDHEKLDQYLGFGDSDHHLPREEEGDGATEETDTVPLSDGSLAQVTLYAHPEGSLKPDVEFDKQKFAAYADSVTLSKLLLLQETLPPAMQTASASDPKTISKLIQDRTRQPDS